MSEALNLSKIRDSIDAVDREIVKYTAYIQGKTSEALDKKYYDKRPISGLGKMEAAIFRTETIFKDKLGFREEDDLSGLVHLLRYRFKIIQQVVDNKIESHQGDGEVKVSYRPRELAILSMIREYSEKYGIGKQADALVASYEELFRLSKEYQQTIVDGSRAK